VVCSLGAFLLVLHRNLHRTFDAFLGRSASCCRERCGWLKAAFCVKISDHLVSRNFERGQIRVLRLECRPLLARIKQSTERPASFLRHIKHTAAKGLVESEDATLTLGFRIQHPKVNDASNGAFLRHHFEARLRLCLVDKSDLLYPL